MRRPRSGRRGPRRRAARAGRRSSTRRLAPAVAERSLRTLASLARLGSRARLGDFAAQHRSPRAARSAARASAGPVTPLGIHKQPRHQYTWMRRLFMRLNAVEPRPGGRGRCGPPALHNRQQRLLRARPVRCCPPWDVTEQRPADDRSCSRDSRLEEPPLGPALITEEQQLVPDPPVRHTAAAAAPGQAGGSERRAQVAVVQICARARAASRAPNCPLPTRAPRSPRSRAAASRRWRCGWALAMTSCARRGSSRRCAQLLGLT